MELEKCRVMVFVPGASEGTVDLVAAFGNEARGGGEEVLGLLYVGGAHYDVVRAKRAGTGAGERRRSTIDWARKVEKAAGGGEARSEGSVVEVHTKRRRWR